MKQEKRQQKQADYQKEVNKSMYHCKKFDYLSRCGFYKHKSLLFSNLCKLSFKFIKYLSSCTNRTLASSGKELKDPFLKALAQREEANRSGKMTVS